MRDGEDNHANTNEKTSGGGILFSDKEDFQVQKLLLHNEKGATSPKDITTLKEANKIN